MERRYMALRTIGTIYKVLGGIVGIITLLLVIGICVASVVGGAALDSFSRELARATGFAGLFSGVVGGLVVSIVGILYGGGMAITLYALGEGVYLLLALEENTRATARLLEQQAGPGQSQA